MFLLPLGGISIALILVGFVVGGLFVTGLVLNVGIGVMLGLLWTNTPDILAYIVSIIAVILIVSAIGCPVGVFFAEAAHIKDSDSKALLTKIYDQIRGITGLLFLLALISFGIEFVVEIGRVVRDEVHIGAIFLDIAYYLSCAFGVGVILTIVFATLVRLSTSRRSS